MNIRFTMSITRLRRWRWISLHQNRAVSCCWASRARSFTMSESTTAPKAPFKPDGVVCDSTGCRCSTGINCSCCWESSLRPGSPANRQSAAAKPLLSIEKESRQSPHFTLDLVHPLLAGSLLPGMPPPRPTPSYCRAAPGNTAAASLTPPARVIPAPNCQPWPLFRPTPLSALPHRHAAKACAGLFRGRPGPPPVPPRDDPSPGYTGPRSRALNGQPVPP